jgi:hypothetical protein
MLGISPRKIQYRLRDYSGRGPRGNAVPVTRKSVIAGGGGAREGESFSAASASGVGDPLK